MSRDYLAGLLDGAIIAIGVSLVMLLWWWT